MKNGDGNGGGFSHDGKQLTAHHDLTRQTDAFLFLYTAGCERESDRYISAMYLFSPYIFQVYKRSTDGLSTLGQLLWNNENEYTGKNFYERNRRRKIFDGFDR